MRESIFSLLVSSHRAIDISKGLALGYERSTPYWETLVVRHPNRRYSKSELMAHGRSTEVFKDIDNAVLHVLSDDLEQVVFPYGETLFRHGDPGEALYIVITGLLKIAINQRDGSEKVIGEIRPGKTVGGYWARSLDYWFKAFGDGLPGTSIRL
jgi:hypothetical protein